MYILYTDISLEQYSLYSRMKGVEREREKDGSESGARQKSRTVNNEEQCLKLTQLFNCKCQSTPPTTLSLTLSALSPHSRLIAYEDCQPTISQRQPAQQPPLQIGTNDV